MADEKKLLYGVSDFAELRARNGWFVDRTDKIRALAGIPFALFLRPRRFRKSLLVSILQCYYDIAYADRFSELFAETKIGLAPTDEQGSYLVLSFNFSAVDKRPGAVQESFNEFTSLWIDKFAERYGKIMPDGAAEAIRSAKDCGSKLNILAAKMQGSGRKICVLVDEYDNFTNTILAEDGERAYHDLCHGDGFFKQFFTQLKAAATGTDAPVARIFVTGVSPVTMDDVTSGFNIATDISKDPAFADFVGFTKEDLSEMLSYFSRRENRKFDPDSIAGNLVEWGGGYSFAKSGTPKLLNTTVVLGAMRTVLETGGFPGDPVDVNIKTDYAKIRHLVTIGRRLNGNFHLLESILEQGGCTVRLSDTFQARELAKPDHFASLLYYFGLLSVAEERLDQVNLAIPNRMVSEFLHGFVPSAYSDVHDVDPRLSEISGNMTKFALNGDFGPVLDSLASLVGEYFSVRDAVKGERVVQTAVCSLLYVAHGPFAIRHEREENGGFTDIEIQPLTSFYPQIRHAAILELKYLRKTDDGSQAALEKILDDAALQLSDYAKDKNLAATWSLAPAGSVTLHRIVLVFQGGDLVLRREV